MNDAHTQVYVEYTDASFTTPKFKAGSRGLLGPTLRVEVGQVLEIVFQVRCKKYPFSYII